MTTSPSKCFKGWADGNASGACCCNCRYHKEDFHHCTTMDRVAHAVENDVPAPVGCVCSLHKGWLCTGMVGEGGGIHSGWSDHGMCEIHQHVD